MQVLNIFHVLIAIAMVALVLVQRGAGATAGAAFGSGASGTVFGSRGAGTFLTKSTWVLATLFCAISLAMAVILSRSETSPAVDLGVISSTSETQRSAVTAPAAEQGLPEAELSVPAADTDLPVIESEGDESADEPAPDVPTPAEGSESSPDGPAENGASEDKSDDS